MELPERIATIIKVNQHTAASFASLLGIQRSSVSHVLNGRNKPSLDFIEKILENFPRVDANWLISGKEPEPVENIVSEKGKSVAYLAKAEKPEKKVIEEGTKTIDRIVIFYTDRTFETYGAK